MIKVTIHWHNNIVFVRYVQICLLTYLFTYKVLYERLIIGLLGYKKIYSV